MTAQQLDLAFSARDEGHRADVLALAEQAEPIEAAS